MKKEGECEKTSCNRKDRLELMRRVIEAKREIVESYNDLVIRFAIGIFIALMGVSVCIAAFFECKGGKTCDKCKERIEIESR